MTQVTLNESPSALVAAKAAAEVTINDATGRPITLRKAGVLAQYRLIEVLGESARNEVYVRMVMPLLYVSAIDGEPVLPLSRKSEVDALIQRLDEHGIAAVMEGVPANFGARDPEADKAAVKN